jgi:hypothetical protein
MLRSVTDKKQDNIITLLVPYNTTTHCTMWSQYAFVYHTRALTYALFGLPYENSAGVVQSPALSLYHAVGEVPHRGEGNGISPQVPEPTKP